MKKKSDRGAYSVTELTGYIDGVLKQELFLQSIWVKGEISGLTVYQKSGHHYFALKDENALISSVMFKYKAARLNFRPVDGMEVFARGSVSVFAKQGKYQLIIEEMELCGQGELFIYLEKLKRELAQAGYFDPEVKRALPSYLRRVGIVTSLQAAALQDILHVFAAAKPSFEVVIADTLVQGAGAPASIAKAIQLMERFQAVDVIIVTRGGGSFEDLMAFNSIEVVKAVYAAKLPVISAVGHEIDFSLADLAADVRASTPTRAAQMIVEINQARAKRAAELSDRLQLAMTGILQAERRRLQQIMEKPVWQSARPALQPYWKNCELVEERFQRALRDNLKEYRHRLALFSRRLDDLSPLKVLARGYSVIFREEKIIKSSAEVAEGDILEARLADGILTLQNLRRR